MKTKPRGELIAWIEGYLTANKKERFTPLRDPLLSTWGKQDLQEYYEYLNNLPVQTFKNKQKGASK